MSEGLRSSGRVFSSAATLRCGGLGGCELVADLAREIGVGCDPGFSIEGDGRRGIEEDALAKFGDRRLARPAEELGDAVEIDEARFV
jgi:hypothetical protein